MSQHKLDLLLRENVSVTFSVDSYRRTMQKFLLESWKKELFIDLIVNVEGKKFKAHRFVLAMISEYFRATFQYQILCNENETKLNITDAGTFEEILKFAYTGEVELNLNNIENILVASNFLGIKSLEEFSEKYLIENLNLGNCIELFIVADRYCLPNLTIEARKKCCRNFKMLYHGEKFFSVPISVIENLLSDEKIKVFKFGHDMKPMETLEGEEFLYSLTIKYISLNWCENDNSHNEKLTNLLTLVKLPMLSTKIMLEGLKSMTNIKENADISSLINLSQISDFDNNDGKKDFYGKNIYPASWKVPRI